MLSMPKGVMGKYQPIRQMMGAAQASRGAVGDDGRTSPMGGKTGQPTAAQPVSRPPTLAGPFSGTGTGGPAQQLLGQGSRQSTPDAGAMQGRGGPVAQALGSAMRQAIPGAGQAQGIQALMSRFRNRMTR